MGKGGFKEEPVTWKACPEKREGKWHSQLEAIHTDTLYAFRFAGLSIAPAGDAGHPSRFMIRATKVSAFFVAQGHVPNSASRGDELDVSSRPPETQCRVPG